MRRRHALELLVSLVSPIAAACGGGGDAAPGPSASTRPVEPPSAPPPGLVARFALRGAETIFGALRRSPKIPLAGTSWATVVVDQLGLPITCAQLVDDRGTPRGAAVAREGGDPEWVVAVPLRDADRLIVYASGGEGAPFRRVRDEAGLDWLERTSEPAIALALERSFLVWGASREAVRTLAPYLARPDHELAALLEGPPGLAAKGEAAVLPALAQRLAGLASRVAPLAALTALADGGAPFTQRLGAWTLSLETTASVAVAKLCSEGGADLVAGLEAGPVSSLWQVAADASVAVVVHQDAAARDAAVAPDRVAALAGLTEEDRGELGAALRELAEARAPRTLLAIEQGRLGLLAWADVAIDDRERAQAALVRVAKRLPIREDAPFGIEATVLERIGDVFRARLGPSERRATMFARLEGPHLLLAAGADPVAALRRAIGDEPRRTLAEVIPAALAGALEEPALAASALDLALVEGEARASDAAPRHVVLSLTRSGAGLALTLACEPSAALMLTSLLGGGHPR